MGKWARAECQYNTCVEYDPTLCWTDQSNDSIRLLHKPERRKSLVNSTICDALSRCTNATQHFMIDLTGPSLPLIFSADSAVLQNGSPRPPIR